MDTFEKIELIEQRFLDLFPETKIHVENSLYGQTELEIKIMSLDDFFNQYRFSTREAAESAIWMADEDIDLSEEDLASFTSYLSNSLSNSNSFYQFEVLA